VVRTKARNEAGEGREEKVFQNWLIFNSLHPPFAKSPRAREKKSAYRNFSLPAKSTSDRLGRLDIIVTFLNNINVFRVQSFFLSNLSVVLSGQIITAAPNAHDFAIPRHLAKQNVGSVSVLHLCIGHDIPHRERLTDRLESRDNPSLFSRSKYLRSRAQDPPSARRFVELHRRLTLLDIAPAGERHLAGA
jgi:hypothetical protein